MLVGITGGIGSGKTLITRLFSLLNVPIYYADDRAKQLMNENLYDQISSEFGKESYHNGKLNRTYLAKKVFSNKEALKKLNAIVHPAVAYDFNQWAQEHDSFKYVLKEAALLIESKSYQQLDLLIVVSSPMALRKERVLTRDNFRSAEDVEKIISNQLPDEEKIKLADFHINNNETELLIPQVIAIDKKIRQH